MSLRAIQKLLFSTLRPEFLLTLVFAVGVMASCSSVGEAAGSAEIINSKAGIDHHFKVGCWTPVEFEVSATGVDGTVTPQLRTVDPDGHAVITRLQEIDLSGASTVRVQTEFRSGRLNAPVQIEVVQDGKVLATRTLRADAAGSLRSMWRGSQIWLLSGEQPAFHAVLERMPPNRSNQIHIAPLQTIEGFISSSKALEGVDLVVLNGDSVLSDQTSRYLREWVQRGGRLIISVGGAVPELQESPLAEWLPFLPTSASEVRNLTGLNAMVPGSGLLRLLGSLPSAEFDSSDGLVLAKGISSPLVVRSAYGLGQVTMLAVRLDQRPLSVWDDQADFAMVLADMPSPEQMASQGDGQSDTGLTPTGVSDISTQIVNSIDRFAEVQRPSHWRVLGWMAVLILLIGPLDYFVLHHVVGRPQLTWITLPVLLVLMTFWLMATAQETNSLGQVSRQFEILDIDTSVGTVRGKSWMSFYSPKTSRNQIQSSVAHQYGTGHADFLTTSWIGRPETGYRGMHRTGEVETFKPVYHLSSHHNEIPDLPTRIWSSGSVISEWEDRIKDDELVVSDLLDPGTGRLQGTVQHRLPFKIENWFIAYRNFAYFPRTARGEEQDALEPGQSFRVDGARSNILRGILVGLTHTSIFREKGKKEEAQVSRTNYDPLNSDPYTVARTITFYETAGGEEYTSLSNQVLSDLDLSDNLYQNQAVLFGRISRPATQFRLDENELELEEQNTFVRIIIPVDFQPADPNAPPEASLLKTP